MLSRLLSRVLPALARRLPPPRVITDLDGRPYLSRYTVFGQSQGPGRKLYLHFFHRSDADRELHNHPWDDSVSLILTGGYREERWEASESRVVTRTIKPWSLNRIGADTFHRATLLDPENGAWTLFFTGQPRQRWGFMDPEKGTYVDYEAYLTAKGKEPLENDN